MPLNQEAFFQTPVLFLIFNRVAVTRKVFDQIKKVRPKYLFVAADGAREDRPEEYLQCVKAREVIDGIDWDCELKLLFREKNLGCGLAVSSAITWFFEHVEAGIILEDDCYPDLSFFPYCEELLAKYENKKEVLFIGGNNFQNGIQRGKESYYFSIYPTSWGWATWRRSWKMFNHDISDAAAQIKDGSLDNVFNSLKEKEHWINSLRIAQKQGDNIWDFHYYYAIWKNKGVCITPNRNLVKNLGFEEGTHYFLKDSTKTNPNCESITFPLIHPENTAVEKEADKYTFDHFYSHSLQRAIRLFRENNLYSIFMYFKERRRQKS